MNQLQKSLSINALFSGISGLLLIVFQSFFSEVFGLKPLPFWIIGLALIFFTCTIVYEIKRQRTLAVSWVIVQDFFWVFGSLIILMVQPFGISRTGHYIIAGVALIVLLMAINQYNALRRKHHIHHNDAPNYKSR